LNEPQALILVLKQIKSVKAIILCEGIDDIDTIEAVVNKMGIPIIDNVALSECGGDCKLMELSSIVATLATLSRKIETIVLVLDADTYSIPQRTNSLVQSLRAHLVDVGEPEPVYGSIYKTNNVRLRFLIKIVGKLDLSLESHEMEDYSIHLLLQRDLIQNSDLANYQKSSDFLEQNRKKAVEIINESSIEEVKQSFDNIIKLVELL
jgi:hypothetical protein